MTVKIKSINLAGYSAGDLLRALAASELADDVISKLDRRTIERGVRLAEREEDRRVAWYAERTEKDRAIAEEDIPW